MTGLPGHLIFFSNEPISYRIQLEGSQSAPLRLVCSNANILLFPQVLVKACSAEQLCLRKTIVTYRMTNMYPQVTYWYLTLITITDLNAYEILARWR